MKLLPLLAAALWAGSALMTASADDLQWPPESAANSEVNVIVVRHADKACSPVDCDLTDKGYAQTDKLHSMVSELVEQGYQVADVFSSNACRTVLTVSPIADDAGLPVHAYPAAEGVATCSYPGDSDEYEQPGTEMRPAKGFVSGQGLLPDRLAVFEMLNSFVPLPDQKYLFIVSDHSNHVCRWIERFDAPYEEYNGEGNCLGGNLDEDDFADIFWLYQAGEADGLGWHVEILEDAFETEH